MKLFLVAGERSGDLHAGNLVSSLKKVNSEVEVVGFGGDYMKNAGAELLAHFKEFSVMGFLEVIKKLPTIRKYIKLCQSSILSAKPDAVVLIDFAGFNMKIASFCKKNNIKVVYYIPPKVWAWNTKRTLKLKKNVDLLLSILPFEINFFKKWGLDAIYVGNPVNDEVNKYLESGTNDSKANHSDHKIVAVLPGSRKQEVLTIKPLIEEIAKQNPSIIFHLAGVDNLDPQIYSSLESIDNVIVKYNNTYDIVRGANAAIVMSGTATLETALLNIPQVVVFKTSKFTYLIAQLLVRVDFISLVNLITNKESVKELVQKEATVEKVNAEMHRLIDDIDYRAQILDDYALMKKNLGKKEASNMAASKIFEFLQ